MADERQFKHCRHTLAPYELIRRFGVWRATLIVLAMTFTLVGGMVAMVAVLTGFPIIPGLLFTALIHLILLPQTYQTNRMFAELELTRAALYRASITDELTGAANRRHFITRLDAACEGATERAYALILLDIDHFKHINDTYGHAAGDAVLRQVSALYQQSTRDDDTFARYGGEEFIFLLLDITPADARGFAERLRRLSEAHVFCYAGQVIPVTVSVGVATPDPAARNADQLLIRVDQALYEAKRSGRNRVVQV